MTMIGTLLTPLVLARAWERGTVEGLLSTPSSVPEPLVVNLSPHVVLELAAALVGTSITIALFGAPRRGSWFAPLAGTAAYLVPALGQRLLIAAVAKNRLIAARMALPTAFPPSLLLWGFLFEIASMPQAIPWLTHAVPARCLHISLQTIFLASDVWPLRSAQLGAILSIGLVFFGAARLRKRRSPKA